MNAMSVREQKTELRRETAVWQRAAIGLFVLSLAVNTIQLALIDHLATQNRAAEERIAQVEYTRDCAIEQLGALVLQTEQDKQSRVEQAAAHEAASVYRYIGECTITAYCCEPYEHICGTGDGLTATGIPVMPGIVAVDPEVIPLGSTVIIDGQKYLAADTGVTGLHIDVAVPTHDEALALGVWTAEVWVVAG